MNITILGAGNIGRTLGVKWLATGARHHVTFGVREPASPKAETARTAADGARFMTDPKEAVEGADVVLIALPGRAVEATLGVLGSALNHKAVIDAANATSQAVMHHFDYIHRVAPQADRFRAFNSLGWENFERPELGGVKIDHFYCGGQGEAHIAVHALISDIGLNPVFLPGLEHIPTLDALTRLWFALAQQRGRRVALKVIAEAVQIG